MGPHLIWDVSMGNVVTWCLTLCTGMFTVGKLSQVLMTLSRDVMTLRTEFRDHEKSDADSFRSVNEGLLNLSNSLYKN